MLSHSLIDNVNDPFLHDDVGNNDFGTIHENIVAFGGDMEGLVGQSGQRGIGQASAVSHDVGHQVIS